MFSIKLCFKFVIIFGELILVPLLSFKYDTRIPYIQTIKRNDTLRSWGIEKETHGEGIGTYHLILDIEHVWISFKPSMYLLLFPQFSFFTKT